MDEPSKGLFQISPVRPPNAGNARSIAKWLNSSFAKSFGGSQGLLDMIYPERQHARVRAAAAEWLTYLLAVRDDGAGPMGEVIGLALERGITYEMLAELIEMMNIQVENHGGEAWLALPPDHPYRGDELQ